MYEHKHQPLASKEKYHARLINNAAIAFGGLVCFLTLGTLGYHYTAGVPWIDALHNASMILSGMGPVVTIDTVGGKLFSSAYAVFSGILFISLIGIVIAPIVHRAFHRFHLQDK